MQITYRELITILQGLSEEELDQTATVVNTDSEEVYPISAIKATTETDILDAGHIYLEI